jgi:hypothetical protein
LIAIVQPAGAGEVAREGVARIVAERWPDVGPLAGKIRGRESFFSSSFELRIAILAPTVKKTTPVPLSPPLCKTNFSPAQCESAILEFSPFSLIDNSLVYSSPIPILVYC